MRGIPARYISETTPSRAIYPSSRQSWYATLLVACKAFYCLGIFVSYDLLKTLHVFPLVCLLKLIAGGSLCYTQRSWCPTLSQLQWVRLSQYTLLKVMLTLCWFYGMSLCGPFRTILITQHYDFVVITGVGALFSGVGSPTNVRGAAMFLAGVVCLLFLDHDEGGEHPGNNHMFSSLTSWLGLADHKRGILLLSVLLLMQVGANALTKRMAQDIGSVKRLHSISTLLEGVALIPGTIISLLTMSDCQFCYLSTIAFVVVVAIFMFVVNPFVDTACISRLEMPRVARLGSVSQFMWALLAALLWQWPLFETSSSKDHMLSGGGVLACILFILGTLGLTSSTKSGAKGSLVGYSASGLPLYTLTQSAFHHTSRSALLLASSVLRQVLADINSRRIFYFLCLNLSFTIVEFMYGVWSNSLGLISDAFHMLFDCSALVMGLLAAVMARWKPSKTFSYGYSRVEDLSGFINGLFLMVVSLFVFSEAMSRLLDPPQISTQRLLAVSVAGLCVNLVGIFAFRHAHTHEGNHSHAGTSHGHSHNANMEGVFLHIMADTLGSCGVIVSSLLIDQFGWFVADPLCSLLIAVLIFASVVPLLKHSALVLLLRTPVKLEQHLPQAMSQVAGVEGVLGVKQSYFWQHCSDTCVGMLHVQATPEASEHNIIQQVGAIFKQIGLRQFSVQVEKEEFNIHMTGLSKSVNHSFNDQDALLIIKAV